MKTKINCNWAADTRIAIIFFTGLMTAGCCSQDVRPGEANIFRAACGVSSGQYKSDVEEKQQEASSSRTALQKEKKRSINLEGKLAVTEERYQVMQRDLNQLEADNLILSRQIATLSQDTQEDRNKQERLEKQLGQLNLEISALKSKLAESPDVADERKLQKLKQEVETLRLIVLEQ